MIKLAWTDKPEWDAILINAVNNSGLKDNVKSLSKNIPANYCMAQLISIMAKYESGFNPKETYKENFKDAKGKYVISRGLLQLSVESVNQKAYGCNVTAESLHDPKVNLECAVKIMTYWANKDGVLMGEPKKGGARYWSVCRKSSRSNAAILKYIESL